MDITTKRTIIFVAFHSLEQLHNFGHLGGVEGSAAEGMWGGATE